MLNSNSYSGSTMDTTYTLRTTCSIRLPFPHMYAIIQETKECKPYVVYTGKSSGLESKHVFNMCVNYLTQVHKITIESEFYNYTTCNMHIELNMDSSPFTAQSLVQFFKGFIDRLFNRKRIMLHYDKTSDTFRIKPSTSLRNLLVRKN